MKKKEKRQAKKAKKAADKKERARLERAAIKEKEADARRKVKEEEAQRRKNEQEAKKLAAIKKKVEAEAAIFAPKASTVVGKLSGALKHRHYSQVPSVIRDSFASSLAKVNSYIGTAQAMRWEEGERQAADAYLKDLSAQGKNVGAQLQLLEKQLG